MRLLTVMLGTAVLTISSGAFANSDQETLNALQNACKLKQVPHTCSVTLPDKRYIGHCVDAKEYGLLCLQPKQG